MSAARHRGGLALKPHEETWGADGTCVMMCDGPQPIAVARFQHAEENEAPSPDVGERRAKLAAQAPAMARLLLRLETTPSTRDGFIQALLAIKYVLHDAGVLP